MAPVEQPGEVSWSVVCAACCHMALVFAIVHLYTVYFFIASAHSLFTLFFSSCTDESTEWSTISACPSLMRFFHRDNTEGTNSFRILCFMFVYVFCKFVLGLILWFWDNLWFEDLRAE